MYMNFITTTDLRTKSSALVNSLKEGTSVSLIHRSKIVGVIKPAKEEPRALTKDDIHKIQELAEKIHLPKTSYTTRRIRYKKHLLENYGKGLS